MEIENLTGYNNESAAVLNRWQEQGNISNIPRALANGTTNAANAALLQSQVSSLYVEDGFFYSHAQCHPELQSLESENIKTVGLAGLRFYVTGQNLLL